MDSRKTIRVKRKDKPEYVIEPKKIVKSKNPENVHFTCSKYTPKPVRAGIIKNLDSRTIRNLCLTQKECDNNICKNKQMWNALYNEKYGIMAPEKKIIDKYFQKTIFVYEEKYKEPFVLKYPNIVKLDAFRDFVIYLDTDSTLRIIYSDDLIETYQDVIDFKLHGRNLFYWNDNMVINLIDYINDDTTIFEFEKIKSFDINDKTIVVKDINGLYIGGQYRKHDYEHNSIFDEDTLSHYIIHSKVMDDFGIDFAKIEIVINNKDVTNDIVFIVQYSDFSGILLLKNGYLYWFDSNDYTISFKLISKNAKMANITGEYIENIIDTLKIYWVDINDNLHIYDRRQDYETSYNLNESIFKIFQYENDEYTPEQGKYDSMMILTNNGNLYVHGYGPIPLLKKIKYFEIPHHLLSNIYDYIGAYGVDYVLTEK